MGKGPKKLFIFLALVILFAVVSSSRYNEHYNPKSQNQNSGYLRRPTTTETLKPNEPAKAPVNNTPSPANSHMTKPLQEIIIISLSDATSLISVVFGALTILFGSVLYLETSEVEEKSEKVEPPQPTPNPQTTQETKNIDDKNQPPSETTIPGKNSIDELKSSPSVPLNQSQDKVVSSPSSPPSSPRRVDPPSPSPSPQKFANLSSSTSSTSKEEIADHLPTTENQLLVQPQSSTTLTEASQPAKDKEAAFSTAMMHMAAVSLDTLKQREKEHENEKRKDFENYTSLHLKLISTISLLVIVIPWFYNLTESNKHLMKSQYYYALVQDAVSSLTISSFLEIPKLIGMGILSVIILAVALISAYFPPLGMLIIFIICFNYLWISVVRIGVIWAILTGLEWVVLAIFNVQHVLLRRVVMIVFYIAFLFLSLLCAGVVIAGDPLNRYGQPLALETWIIENLTYWYDYFAYGGVNIILK